MSQNRQLLKCLECRLVGPPPVFNLPPPPALPTIDQLLFNKLPNQTKRCLKIKKILNRTASQANFLNKIKPAASSLAVISSSSSAMIGDDIRNSEPVRTELTQTQTVALFSLCLSVFIVVLFVAFIFVYKLIRIRKQMTDKSKSNNTSTSLSSSNTMTSTDLKADKISSFYNQLFEQNRPNSQNSQNYSVRPVQIKMDQEYDEIASQQYTNSNIVYTQYDSSLVKSDSSCSSSSISPLLRLSSNFIQPILPFNYTQQQSNQNGYLVLPNGTIILDNQFFNNFNFNSA